jgi:myotubularin-related protein 6/7/8
MRNSLKGVEEAVALCGPEADDETKFLSKLEDTNWLFHMNKILKASVLVAEKLENEKAGVLIHCSDGWDRTAQLCATAQLLLDPFYRTIEGFCVLIEKDWCSFGHKFYDRIGHYSNAESQERSPVFLQWLDVVRILLQQFPLRFQFTEHLLVFIMDAVFSCQFGNFLGNCEKDREDLNCREKTKSVWSYVLFHMDSFVNSAFVEHAGPLWPSTSPRKCNLWEQYFCRWVPEMHPRECSGQTWRSDWGTHLSCVSKSSSSSISEAVCDEEEGEGEDEEDEDASVGVHSKRIATSTSSSKAVTGGASSTIKTSRVLNL